MSGPESLRLRALIDKHVGDDKARNELMTLVERCATAEAVRDHFKGKLYSAGTTALAAIETAQSHWRDYSAHDPR